MATNYQQLKLKNTSGATVTFVVSYKNYLETELSPTKTLSPGGEATITYIKNYSTVKVDLSSSGYENFSGYYTVQRGNQSGFSSKTNLSIYVGDAASYGVVTCAVTSAKRSDVTLSLVAGTGIWEVTGAGTYSYNKSVTVTASVRPYYEFDGWYLNNTKVSSLRSYTINVTSSYTLTAKAEYVGVGLTLVAGTGIKSVTGSGTYVKGTSVTATAELDRGYEFKSWSTSDGSVLSYKNPYTFTINSTLTVYANTNKLTGRNISIKSYCDESESTSGGDAWLERDGFKHPSSVTLYDGESVWMYASNNIGKSFKFFKIKELGGYPYNVLENPSSYKVVGRDVTIEAHFVTNVYNVTVNGNGGIVTNTYSGETFDKNTYPEKPYGFKFAIGNFKCQEEREGASQDANYEIKFYANNKLISSKNTVNGKIVETYKFLGWFIGSKEVSSAIVTIESDTEIKASWGKGENKVIGGTVSFPDATIPGYTGGGSWFLGSLSGNKINESYTFTSNSSVYTNLVPNVYQVKYQLRDGEDWETDSNQSFSKTFDTDYVIGPNKVTRFGYKFVGWCKEQNITNAHSTSKHYTPGSNFDDTFYIENGYQGSVELYPCFDPINNENEYQYYSDGKLKNPKESYNIESINPYKRQAPSDEFVSNISDYVFMGWSDTKPEGDGYVWGDGSEKGMGFFSNPNDVPSSWNVQLPLEINIDKIEEWGVKPIYYGLWTKTGKYIFTQGEWKKISTAYIKVGNEWKVMTDLSIKTPDGWKHEV